jgi:pyruvate-ferredoxin/flavodoxin oxidoreductase
LPVVFHIGARALTSHSLNVHAGHDDVMSVADCGWGILFGRNAQEAADLALIARRAAESCQTPFLNVQDGFLTTHTVENILAPEKELMKEFIGHPGQRLINLFDPAHPLMTGVVQDQDSYMKGKISQRHYYVRVRPAVVEAMETFRDLTGRYYRLIDTYRMEDAEFALVGMGGMMETAQATVDYIRRELDVRVGVVHVTAYRPFPGPDLVRVLRGVKAFTVLERMDDPLAPSNPLMRDIKTAFMDARLGLEEYQAADVIVTHPPRMIGCSAGLGSRDVRAGHFIALVHNMQRAALGQEHKERCTVGIRHETSLDQDGMLDPDVRPEGAYSMRGHSIGGFGSVTTNKVIATICGEVFGLDVQAYPKYGSSKKGLPTTYYLTLAHEHVRTHCELEHVEFIPLNDVNALNLGDPLRGLARNGVVFLHTPKTTPAEVWGDVPAWAKQRIRDRNARVLALDTLKIAEEVATDGDLRIRMMGIVLVGVFLKVTPFADRASMTYEDVMAGVEQAVRKYFGKRGEQVVQDNMTCIRRAYEEVLEIPTEMIRDKAWDTADVRLPLAE